MGGALSNCNLICHVLLVSTGVLPWIEMEEMIGAGKGEVGGGTWKEGMENWGWDVT